MFFNPEFLFRIILTGQLFEPTFPPKIQPLQSCHCFFRDKKVSYFTHKDHSDNSNKQTVAVFEQNLCLIQSYISLLAGLRLGCGRPQGRQTASLGDLFLTLLFGLLQTHTTNMSVSAYYL